MSELFIIIGLLVGICAYTALVAQLLVCVCERINRYFRR